MVRLPDPPRTNPGAASIIALARSASAMSDSIRAQTQILEQHRARLDRQERVILWHRALLAVLIGWSLAEAMWRMT